MSQKLKIKVPASMAEELEDRGMAEIQRTARSSGWELAWNAASSASVVITLLQGPETIKAFTQACFGLVKKSQDTHREVQKPRLEAIGRGGQLSLNVTSETDLHEVEQFLEKVIFVEQATSESDE